MSQNLEILGEGLYFYPIPIGHMSSRKTNNCAQNYDIFLYLCTLTHSDGLYICLELKICRYDKYNHRMVNLEKSEKGRASYIVGSRARRPTGPCTSALNVGSPHSLLHPVSPQMANSGPSQFLK